MGEDELLELIDPILQRHKVCNCLVSFIRVVYGFETEVLLVLERAVELGVLSVERELGEEVVDVVSD